MSSIERNVRISDRKDAPDCACLDKYKLKQYNDAHSSDKLKTNREILGDSVNHFTTAKSNPTSSDRLPHNVTPETKHEGGWLAAAVVLAEVGASLMCGVWADWNSVNSGRTPDWLLVVGAVMVIIGLAKLTVAGLDF